MHENVIVSCMYVCEQVPKVLNVLGYLMIFVNLTPRYAPVRKWPRGVQRSQSIAATISLVTFAISLKDNTIRIR